MNKKEYEIKLAEVKANYLKEINLLSNSSDHLKYEINELQKQIEYLTKENNELRPSAVKCSMLFYYLRKIKKIVDWEEI